jgi:GT2 family glycosyltransferase
MLSAASRLSAHLEVGDRVRAAANAARVQMRPSGIDWTPAMSDDDVVRCASTSEMVIPTASEPLFSVIVPVYGKPGLTWHCLDSIRRCRAGRSFEVVVVDDASPDETPRVLKAVRGIRVVTNPSNSGFVRSCNAGARAARGSHLVFLNNDAVVTDGWLEALHGTYELHPDAGVVGAKLLFPDGDLQEAGGIVFRDGVCSHYGRNRRRDLPAYSFVREVDYVSGACLAIPAQLFRDVGGFDTAFAPAYYEDTDLAFRVRAAGYRVLYQPACVIIHDEGSTHGTDLGTGGKRFQTLNRATFFERWRTTLLSEHPPPGRRTRESADRRRGPALLVVGEPSDPRLTELALAAVRARYRVVWWATAVTEPAALSRLAQHGVESLGLLAEYSSLSSLLRRRSGSFDALLLVADRDAGATMAAAWRHPRVKTILWAADPPADEIARCADVVLAPSEHAARMRDDTPEARVIEVSDAALFDRLIAEVLCGSR